MATNFNRPGETETFTAPVGDVASGKAYFIGSLLVIATADGVAGDPFEGAVGGVWDVPKLSDDDWEEGDLVYFDPDASPAPIFTSDVGSPALTKVGYAVQDSADDAETGRVRLDGGAR